MIAPLVTLGTMVAIAVVVGLLLAWVDRHVDPVR